MHVLHTFANNSSVPYLTWFAERAVREGNIHYTFLVMYKERPAMLDEMRKHGFSCEWIPYDPEHRKRDMIRALPKLWRHMVRYKPDIVHCNLFDDTLPGLIAARLAGVKVRITTRQDTGFHWMHAPRWVSADRHNVRMSTHVIAISGECKRFLVEKERAPEEKITLVHNGIPPERFTQQDPQVKEQLRERFKTEGRYPVIGTVARFIEWKGYRQIVQAANRIVEQNPKALFLFCGEGEQQEEIRQLVKEAGLEDHIVFTGWVDRSQIPSFHGILDLYLHAAILEPFGLVYAEAMMNAVPVVSTATGAALDAIRDGENGFLATERSGVALADAVLRLLNGDPKKIGEAGRSTALELFPFEVMWKGTTALYERALGPKR